MATATMELQPHAAEELQAEENPPPAAVNAMERWNQPRSNVYRTLATFWTFLVMGANDAVYGALIPYLESYYSLNYTVVSLIFLSPLVGYVMAALLNYRIHQYMGQRGVALIAPCSHLISYVVNCVHPPYPVLVISFIFAGFGNGLGDSAWNAWIGNMANANELLGLLHGVYGVGAVLSPLAATSIITKAKLPWYYFYYIMVYGPGPDEKVKDGERC
ncbi:Mfs transporter [Aspergillus sp. HF37]|nr:Mfs transporter [Aspergillus sp. HF37]